FCVASVLGSSCTTCTLRSCAPYAPINSSKYLCFERSLLSPSSDAELQTQDEHISPVFAGGGQLAGFMVRLGPGTAV
ncbi:MAG: hypothetical protein LBJ16_02095, partial [Holosporaceae bacterium]|nr:hypothetical protein [Holosporaceae bacterium]